MNLGDFHPQPGGEAWPRQSNFAPLSQLTPSEAYLGLLTPVTFLVLIKKAASLRNYQHH